MMKAILVGFGFIGRNLVKAIWRRIDILNEEARGFKLVGAADIDGYAYSDEGLNLERLSKLNKISEYPELSLIHI